MITTFLLFAQTLIKKIPYQVWLLIGLVVSFWFYGHLRFNAGQAVVQAKWDASTEKGKAIVAQLKLDAAKVNTVIDTQWKTKTEYIYVKGKTITEQIPVYIPVDTPDLPAGFRVLHDAAATSTIPGLPGSGESSPVRVEDATETIVTNYTQCLVWREEVVSWREWYREQSQLWRFAVGK